MTMSDGGDKVCPLCAEEMDLTDQQLKPCKCGYEICVWCWHHIVEMAEKEETGGRCPACRTPYDKDRIVGMSANCDRLMPGVNSERKYKSQKVKPKASAETRKQLGTVRVIQRNLVYIIGLPLNLCDESLLEGREYFGQYGSVLKVSISRPASTANQQASNNNTFSVYINYAREEEAVRCIQAVHNYMLDGKPLRASFGTTKYCHAWLRNMNCSNPDCLYLHDIGNQEDSFTKDEIISAYSRVPKISSSSSQRRTGSVLPPPADELTSSGSSANKNSIKNASNKNTTGQSKVTNGSLGRPTVLPAAASWGLRLSNGQSCSQSSMKHNVESNSSFSFSSVSNAMSSAWNDDPHISEAEGKPIFIGNAMSNLAELHLPKDDVLSDHEPILSDLADTSFQAGTHYPTVSAWDDDPVEPSNFTEESYDSQASGRSELMSPQRCSTLDAKVHAAGVGLPSDAAIVENNHITTWCPSSSDTPVLEKDKAGTFSAPLKKMNGVNGNSEETFGDHLVDSEIIGFITNHNKVNQDKNASPVISSADIERNGEQKTSLPNPSCNGLLKNPASKSQQLLGECLGKSISEPFQLTFSNAQALRKSGWKLESEQQACQSSENRTEDPSMDLRDIREGFSDVSNQRSCSPQPGHSFSKSRDEPNYTVNDHAVSAHSSPCGESAGYNNQHKEFQTITQSVHKLDSEQHEDKLSNICKPTSSRGSTFISSNEGLVDLDRLNVEETDKFSSVRTRESSIISDIFSLDFDPWDDSLSIANNISKLLGGKNGSEGVLTSPLNTQNNSQSRFSFARQENQDSFVDSSISEIGHTGKGSSVKTSYADTFQDNFTGRVFLGNETTKNNATVTSDRSAGVLRARVSAPPGFSLPRRAAPPGFGAQDCRDQSFETASDIRLVQNSLVGNHHQLHPTEHSGDIEFIDPAILAVGKGLLPIGSGTPTYGLGSPFPAQFSNSECDPRLQLLMQQSLSSHQTMRFPDHMGDNFLPLNDSYIASHILAQNQNILSPLAQFSHQKSRSSPILSSHWDALSNFHTSPTMGMNDSLRSQRFGPNNYYLGERDDRFRNPGSSGTYRRSFGI
ncbi:hypothetical protein KSP40_PGU006461 [Platanthera guangdongensis]|uniref:CCR4-NOT transcription complex subunit 4 n=1 Tax=Platanthera guangdongensis TaxID=2320717 RepID=A0ABR2LV87_9ASPA